MSSQPPDRPGPRARTARKALVAAAVTAAGAGAAVALERAAVRRARARPDPEREERLAERPGIETRVASFDRTELAVNEAGPEGAPTLLVKDGELAVDFEDEIVKGCCITRDGEVVHEATKKALGAAVA